MKRYLTTIIALAVLAVVIVGAVVVIKVTNKTPDGPASPTTDPATEAWYGKLFSFSTEDVVKVESSFRNQYTMELREEDGKKVWKCSSDPELEIFSDSFKSKVSYILGVFGTRIEDVDSLADYGFSEDGKSEIYVRLYTADGQSAAAYVGNYDFTRNYRYVYYDDGSSNVYKVSAFSSNYLIVQKEDMVHLSAFTYLSTDTPVYFLVYQNGQKTLELQCTGIDEEEGASWKVKFPIERDSQNTSVNEIIKAMRNMPLMGISEEAVAEEDLVKYGLSPAGIEYYLYMKDKDGENYTYKIKVGQKTDDGNYYYCLVDDGNNGMYDVYMVSTANIYRNVDVLSYVDTFLYLKDSTVVQTVDIDVAGEKHSMRYLYEPHTKINEKGEEEEEILETRFFDGKEAPDNDDYSIVVSDNRFTVPTAEDIAKNRNDDITDDVITANPYDCYNHLLACLYADLTLYQIDLNEPTPEDLKECIATVTYTETDGSVYKIQLFKRDNTTAYAYINDKYAGGYCRTTMLFGDDYANYDYLRSLEAVKAVMKLVP